MTVGSLFSGIGGIELGLERTGKFKTIWNCEIDPYASMILKKHWPEVPNLGDITKVNWNEIEKPELICGGFPCQDISIAGKGKGIVEGKRSGLWSEFAKTIRILRPRYALIENVPMLADRGLWLVIADLASFGYDAEWGTIRASDVGANHRRERLFIIAYTDGERHIHRQSPIQPTEGGEPTQREPEPSVHASNTDDKGKSGQEGQEERRRRMPAEPCNEIDAANDSGERRQRFWKGQIPQFPEFSWCKGIRRIEDLRNRFDIPEPLICGGHDGVPCRLDRTKCLGNAVVPQVAQVIGEWIAEDYEMNL